MFELWNWVGTLNNSAGIESRVHSCKHRHTWESCKFRYIRRKKPQERFDQVQDMHDDIYTAQHSTAPHNLILVYLSVNLISQIQMFDVSTFLLSFQCLKSWRPSDPLSFSLKILHFFFFFNHFSLWSLSSLEKSTFLTSRTHSHKPQGHLLNCMAHNYPISIIL